MLLLLPPRHCHSAIRRLPVKSSFPSSTMVHQVKEYFPTISKIVYDAKAGNRTLAYREYNASEVILGKTMEDWCRFAVCWWHTFGNTGADPFGGETYMNRVWNDPKSDATLSAHERAVEAAKCKADAAFEMFVKLGVKFYTFHDADIVDEGEDGLEEFQSRLDEVAAYLLHKQKETGVKLLWGTTNLFGHRRFMNGAFTSPDMKVFARAAAHVKKVMEITKMLGGENFVFWGGREGFQSVLNTDMKKELDHMAAFFKLAIAYKKEIGATYQFLIEPKPREPMKHQYDYDAATVIGFLRTYGLENDFKVNIEPNHTTLAGHDYEHDIYFSAAYGMLGSVDCNTGDAMVGWDTDQFLMDEKKAVLVMKKVVEMGGLAPGGLNFDAKVRRESSELEDLFIAHVGSMDCFARGLRQAAKLLEKNELGEMVAKRYSSWKSKLGERIEAGVATLDEVAAFAKEAGEPEQKSGKQELAELILYRAVQ